MIGAQAPAQPDSAVAVKGGGVFAKGWTGKIDASEEKAGQVLNNAKLSQAANGSLEVTTGPATTYWNPANKAAGDYTVKATFTESNYMGLMDHPHPYGIVIGGNDLGTPTQSFLYCAAYGNGTFIVRGMGPDPFAMGGRRPEANEAVHKAAGKGSSVTQEIAVTVKGDTRLLRDQRKDCGDLSKGRGCRRRQAEVHRWRLRDPFRAQHVGRCDRPFGHQALTGRTCSFSPEKEQVLLSGKRNRCFEWSKGAGPKLRVIRAQIGVNS